MNVRTAITILIVILIIIGVYFLSTSFLKTSPNVLGAKTIGKIHDKEFRLDVVETAVQKQKGLSNRRSINDKQGMLFLFDTPGYYSFWMKEMKFPIDIIFIKGDKIVTIHKNVMPPEDKTQRLPLYAPSAPADKVLEIGAGLSDKYNFKEGDTIQVTP